MPPVIKVENLSKMYRLGEVGTGTVRDDLARTWAKLRGKEDPFQKVGHVNRRDEAADGEHDYVWALQDINFEVEQGEILGIIGRNGAGKSTLLKLLSRITAPTTGRIRARGRIASLLEVGTGFHPELTGRENIYLNGALLGMTRREVTGRLEEIVEFSGCAKYIDTPVKRYSSGMMVRLGFSVAAHLECEILIVDEVLAVGDADFQKRCLGKMSDVASDGRTILFVSHNMAAVTNLCSTSVLLESGRVTAIDETSAIVEQYLVASRDRTEEPLLERVDRTGRGELLFSRVELRDSNGRPIDIALTGTELRIVLSLKHVTTNDFSNCRVGVVVENATGTSLFVCSTETSGDGTMRINRLDGSITCRIPKLPLSRGQYSLVLYLETDGVIQDWVRNGFNLTVEDADFFGTGRNCPRGWEGKSVLVPHHWSSGNDYTVAAF